MRISDESKVMSNEDGIRKFEDLIAWQKARKLTMSIYEVTGSDKFSRDFGLRDQIRRASVSVMSNIAEGYERISKADFGRFLVMAKASCAEVRSQLYVALDIGYISQDQFDEIHDKGEEVGRIIGGLRKSVMSNE